MEFIVWAVLAIVVCWDIFLFLRLVEYGLCACVRHQAPYVASRRMSHMAVVNEIRAHYPNARTAVEIGAGYGRMARYVARHAGLRVTALENMPFTAWVARACDFLSRADSKTVWCDAFEYLAGDGEKFDIALAYMGDTVMPRIRDVSGRFRVLISLDFPMPGMTPVRQIHISNGYTRYHNRKWPHRLYVYEF